MGAVFFQTLRSDAEKWNIPGIAVALSSGLRCNRIWEQLINYNNSDSAPLDVLTNSIVIALAKRQTLSKMTRLAVTNDFFRNHLSAFNMISSILLTSNVIALFCNLTDKKISDGKDVLDKTFIIIWKSTPYLLIITNIALFIVQTRTQPQEGLLALAMTGLTLLDITPFKPKAFDSYLDVYLRIPLDLVHLYYAEGEERFVILMGWAQNSKIRKTFQKFLPSNKIEE